MGVRTLYDPTERKAVMYDSTTGTAFGPLFDDQEELGEFLATFEDEGDPRAYTERELHERRDRIREAREASESLAEGRAEDAARG